MSIDSRLHDSVKLPVLHLVLEDVVETQTESNYFRLYFSFDLTFTYV